jgi:hypothetical protein
LSSDSDSRGIDKEIYQEQIKTLFKANLGYSAVVVPAFTDSAAV